MLKLITGNGEQVTAYEYDRFGNVILFTDAEGNTEKYEYDLKNNLIQKIDRNGNIIKNTYDSIGRLIKTEGQTETGKAAEYMSFSYSNNGMVLTEANESLKTTYTYDSLGRTIKSEDSRGTAKSYGYDLNNNRISQNIAVNGKSVYKADYSYDRLDRLKNLIKDGKAEAVYSYDENGNRASLTYGNGIQTSYTYNKANLITNLVNKTNGKVLSSYEYSYYLDGNQASKSDHEGTVTTYIYDDLNRLLSEREISGDNSVAKSYEYDNAGNRAFMTVEENGEVTKTTYTYDKTNRLLREESREIGTLNQVINAYVYDGNGNQTMKLVSTIKVNEGTSTPRLRIQLLTDDGTMDSKYSYLEPELRGSYKDISTAEQPALKINLLEGFVSTDSKTEIYTYDIFNRLEKVQMPGVKAEYTYKSDGLRISKNVNGDITNHIWDGGFLVSDASENYEDIEVYYRGINLILGEGTGYYIYNAHGDVVQLADTEGEIVKEYSYDAFGVEKDIEEADENPFRDCGEYYDKETGTIYLRARYYVPRTGRFLSEDGIRDGLNWYTYCTGNPIRYIDPTGHYFIVADREFDYIGGGEYHLGGLKGTYSIVNVNGLTRVAKAGVNNVPIIGGFLSESLISSEILGDIIFESSLNFNFSLFSDEATAILGSTLGNKKLQKSFEKVNDINEVYAIYGYWSALYGESVQGTLFDQDRVIFGLMDMYGISSTGYASEAAAHAQLEKITSIMSSNPDYFGTEAGGTSYGESQFLIDYGLYKMSSSERLGVFLKESGYNNWTVWSSVTNNVGWDDPAILAETRPIRLELIEYMSGKIIIRNALLWILL